jgi:tripartite-type tricarboxylate transporter receptor subunit TctC
MSVAVAPGLAFGQYISSKPIRLIHGFNGGGIDLTARLIAPYMSEALGAPVIVEQKPGATGLIGAAYVAKAPGDGYTFLLATPASVLVATQTSPHRTFDPLKDLKAVNMLYKAPSVFAVSTRQELRRMKDLAALSRTRQFTVGINGLGGSQHVTVESLNKAYNARFEVVPFKSSADTAVAVIAGHIDMCMSDPSGLVELEKAGKLAWVAISAAARSPEMPDVPTLQEDYAGLASENWFGIFAPGTTPPALVDKVASVLSEVVMRPDMQAHFKKISATSAAFATAGDFQKFVGEEYHRYEVIIKERGIVIRDSE